MYNQQPVYQQQGQFQGAGMYGPGVIPGNQYQPIPQAKMTQVLSQEEIKELRRKGSGFSLDIPAIEFTRSKCTHKEGSSFATIPNPDGTHTCTICGATFTLADYDVETARQITEQFLSLFESTKLYYLNAPETYIENITQMIPVIRQIPELYRIALADFQKYENGGNGLQNRGGMFGANLLNSIVSPSYGTPMGGGYYQQMNQPQYQQYPQQPGYYQQAPQGNYGQPVGDPAYYQQVPGQYPQQGYQAPMSNGFGYTQPQGGQPIQGQQQPVVNQGTNAQSNQTVSGGQGQAFTKDNAQKNSDPSVTKVYNA